ncbi:MAG: homoserine kinase [Bacteriovoracaceae bacterium]
MKEVSAFAPATIANVGVGFDILGFSVTGAGDTIHLKKNLNHRNAIIKNILGTPAIPTQSQKNTASVTLQKLIDDKKLEYGFDIILEKGIPLSSGLGGSAASAVAAVVAGNALLEPERKLTNNEMIYYALEGEYVASESRHADNIAPSLMGGLCLVSSLNPINIVNIPQAKIWVSIINPKMQLETKSARAILSKEVTLNLYIKQSMLLSSFICANYENNLELLKNSFQDLIIEPQRKKMIPCFDIVKEKVLENNALGFTIAGAGPTVFALSETENKARDLTELMKKTFHDNKVEVNLSITSPFINKGAFTL